MLRGELRQRRVTPSFDGRRGGGGDGGLLRRRLRLHHHLPELPRGARAQVLQRRPVPNSAIVAFFREIRTGNEPKYVLSAFDCEYFLYRKIIQINRYLADSV